MARLYADEQFPRKVVEFLRTLGHDVLTVQESGKANQRIPDEEVLAFAISNERVVITVNRFNFIRLHTRKPEHAGIIVCTENENFERMARQINEAITSIDTLAGRLIRVYKFFPAISS